jgi:His-Xaa-Ser system radical SAM maturase HxsC
MCSQPPRDIDDSPLIDELLEAIPLMSPETREIGITGGEPTLVGNRLLDVLTALRMHMPSTGVHMLTNGRTFHRGTLARDIAKIEITDLMLGVPVYADTARQHDFVVQAKGAFEETIRGLYNLARARVPIEIRFVIHAQTVSRLPQTARFIARNLPFVRQVAFMGLEMMGFARSNVGALWIEPSAYVEKLAEAIEELPRSITPLIYNHPLCVLPKELWPFSRQSISDWKNIYHGECQACAATEICGGFFSSSHFRRMDAIKPLSISDLACHTAK